MMDTELLSNLVGCYFVLAIGYNILSLILYDAKGRPLTSNKPVQAIVMMAASLHDLRERSRAGRRRLDVSDDRVPVADPALRHLPAPDRLR